MSISDRLKLLLRSEINALKGGSEHESDAVISELEQEFNSLRREEEKLIVKIRRLRDEADMWEERASFAAGHQKDDLAKSAIKKKNQLMDEVDHERHELREVREYISKVNATLNRFRDNVSDFPETYNFFKDSSLGEESSYGLSGRSDPQDSDSWAHRHLRRPHKQPHAIHGSNQDPFSSRLIDDESHFEEFNRISDRLEHENAELDTEQELAGYGFYTDPLADPAGAKFEAEYQKIEREQQLKRELDALKSRFKD